MLTTQQQTCPHCHATLVEFVDDLLQCPSDYVVFPKNSGQTDEPDETLAKLACPTGSCD